MKSISEATTAVAPLQSPTVEILTACCTEIQIREEPEGNSKLPTMVFKDKNY